MNYDYATQRTRVSLESNQRIMLIRLPHTNAETY